MVESWSTAEVILSTRACRAFSTIFSILKSIYLLMACDSCRSYLLPGACLSPPHNACSAWTMDKTLRDSIYLSPRNYGAIVHLRSLQDILSIENINPKPSTLNLALTLDPKTGPRLKYPEIPIGSCVPAGLAQRVPASILGLVSRVWGLG